MDERAVEFDESELQRCQPIEMVGIHGCQQVGHGSLTFLLFQVIRLALTAVTALGQQLVVSPAVDAVRRKITWPGSPQPLQQGVARRVGSHQVTQHKQAGDATLTFEVALDPLIQIKVSVQTTHQCPAFHQRSHTWLASSARSAYSKPWLSLQAKTSGRPASTMARHVLATSYATSRMLTSPVVSL